MRFHILTLFPEMVRQGLDTSIIGRAVNRGLLSVEAVDDFHQCHGYPAVYAGQTRKSG